MKPFLFESLVLVRFDFIYWNFGKHSEEGHQAKLKVEATYAESLCTSVSTFLSRAHYVKVYMSVTSDCVSCCYAPLVGR